MLKHAMPCPTTLKRLSHLHRSKAGEAVRRLLPPAYDALVRNTKAFKEAVAQTLAELARQG
ncbi:hypothetical protein ACIQNG_35280 [Streptomyces sp. NPDC091377]|uniref:hypothetical protein n=1 Tax=Streptomyces sp. NPDC091377 TaxID=3365995 RepID=UPI0037FCCA6E